MIERVKLDSRSILFDSQSVPLEDRKARSKIFTCTAKSSNTSVQMNEAVEKFKSFTGAKEEVAQRYLGLTENIPEHAIQLFYDSPDLALNLGTSPSNLASQIQDITQPQSETRRSLGQVEVINLDDDRIDAAGDNLPITETTNQVTNVNNTPDIEDDESIARRIQAELYDGASFNDRENFDGVRAPIERRKEILVGGDDQEWESVNTNASNLQQVRASPFSRPGVFNQVPVPSIWQSNSDPVSLWQGLSQATGGASETSSKAARLAELFRPPFEIMRQVSWEIAREQGKTERKWIIVNVQDQSIFDCQQLNRDLWKDPGIKEAIRENFIFVQYSNDDPRAKQYIQFYFHDKENDTAYPHIAIIDPRTGEQVKMWSGHPVPQASDFLMQIYEFLDRFSLEMTKKNPISNHKLENTKRFNIEQMTEEEMLDIAVQNSLAKSTVSEPFDSESDDFLRHSSDTDKGKGKEVTEISNNIDKAEEEISPLDSCFAQISSKNFHTEPQIGPKTTRIQFKHAGGRIVRIFNVNDPIRRIYEWLKSDPVEGKSGVEFELKWTGKDLIAHLDESIEKCGLKNATIMVELLQSDE